MCSKSILLCSALIIFFYSCSIPAASPIKPHVSIITSVFNGDNFIEGFLHDIVQQTIFHQCELIIINANSPGNEEPIIKSYMQRYPNIRYTKLDHDPGIYGVWNMAIEMAHSDIITNANIDDRFAKECHEVHLKALLENPTIDLVYSDYYVTHKPNETFETRDNPEHVCMPEFSPLNMGYCLPNNHPMWRKRLHRKYGLFNAAFKHAGDHEMWLRAVAKGARFMKIPGVYSLFYYNPEGLSTDTRRKAQRNTEEVIIYSQYNYIFNTAVYNPENKNEKFP